MIEKLYTIKEVAEELDLNPQTVQRFVREGRMKSIRVGRVYRIKEAHLDEFIKDK